MGTVAAAKAEDAAEAARRANIRRPPPVRRELPAPLAPTHGMMGAADDGEMPAAAELLIEEAQQLLKAGEYDRALTTLEQGTVIAPNDGSVHLMKALADGAVSRSDLNSALTHMFDVLMRLGQFDTEAEQPLLHAGVADVGNDAHRAIALEAAVQGVVLLTNHNATLPLSVPTKQLTVALVGQTECKLGPYAATPRAEDKTTACDLADALNATAAAVTIAKNLSTACDQTTADVIVAVLDTNCLGESHDRGGGAKIAFLCAIFTLLVKTITFPKTGSGQT